MIKFDKNNIGVEQVKDGVYEVYANKFDIQFSQSGNEMAVFNYYIRDDVQQPSQGAKIMFDRFVDTPKAEWRLNQFMDAIGLQHGQEFQDMVTWAKSMLLKPIKVKVELEENSNGKKYPTVKRIEKSAFPNFSIQPVLDMNGNDTNRVNQFNGTQQQVPMQQSQSPQFEAPIDITEDDLPF